MLAKTYSYGILGIDAHKVCIEVDITRGLPGTTIVGLPDNSIKESRERIRSAIKNSGYKYPGQKIILNLSPADTKKEGPSFDLAMALGVLAASGQISGERLADYAIIGELSLDGQLQPVNGTLSIAIAAAKDQYKGIILPTANAPEGCLVNNIPVFAMKTLQQAIQFLENPSSHQPFPVKTEFSISEQLYDVDFADVKGQTYVKRGLEIAAAGGHNALMIGNPGTAKSMLARRFSTILPEMTREEALETTKIYSAIGALKNKQGLVTQRPFRSPHHTTSAAAIVGGGTIPRPGEITLSHNGVLFLDELPEFSRHVLESLRQPLEDHTVTIARANKTIQFPCRFILICAMNPTQHGRLENNPHSYHQMEKYLSRLSGPLLDRIDIHLSVPDLPVKDLFNKQSSESSMEIKKRTVAARQRQRDRLKNTGISTNAAMNFKLIRKFCALDKNSELLLKSAIEDLNLSARAHDKILKVARTIADLNGCENIQEHHICEAIQFRNLDKIRT